MEKSAFWIQNMRRIEGENRVYMCMQERTGFKIRKCAVIHLAALTQVIETIVAVAACRPHYVTRRTYFASQPHAACIESVKPLFIEHQTDVAPEFQVRIRRHPYCHHLVKPAINVGELF